jgi:two-component system response regulator PilR (NtrC family)/two-component system response regulator HydG
MQSMAKRRNRGLRIEHLMRDTAVPIFLLNADREIAFFNAACEALVGRQADHVLGLCCRYHGPAGTADLPDLAASLAPSPEVMAGHPAKLRALIKRPDGERLWREIHFFPCRDATGTLVMVMGLISEIGELPAAAPAPADLHEGLLRLRDRLYSRFGLDKLIGSSALMARVIAQVRLAARSDANVLIWGERGTGKDLIARTIHAESDRKSAPFIPIDCALLPPELTERDLFGVSSEQFYASRPSDQGLMRSSQGGTLYLKNLSRMPRDTQSRLLERFDNQFVHSHGPSKKYSPEVRIIADDVREPAQLVEGEQIRRDVFYSLSTIVIALPPLRDRKEDVPLLAQMFVELANANGNKQVSGLAASAIEILLAYDWSGNVCELRDVIAQAHDACDSNLITADNLTPRIQGARGGAFVTKASDAHVDLDAMLAETERKLIEQAIKRARGNKSVAAELLCITRARLYRRMQLLGMNGADEGESSSIV